MGPFGTVVILPMFPELQERFGVSREAMGWGFTAYLIPFAFLLLVSGTLGERWGRQRTVRWTYVAYTVASLLCAFAPNFAVFIVARMLQGAANAFITPLLVAGLAELVAPERFGRSLGVYSSFQAFGSVTGPVLGGVAADVDWRLAFIGTAAISAALSLFPPSGAPRESAWPEVRALLTRPMLVLGVGAFFGAAGPLGISILVGVAARDELGLSGTRAGLLLVLGALAAMLLGPVWGRMADRLGLRYAGIVAAAGSTAIAACLAISLTPLAMSVVWAATGGIVAFAVVALQGLGATVVPDNRGGALSFLLSFRFLGHAAGPLIWLPVFDQSVRGAFIGASLLGLVLLAAFILGPGSTHAARQHA